jgi:cell division protein ZapA (FtsZ GTPase activity inhibitor)
VTAPRHAVRVVIGGEEFTVRSELSPEYTREVAAHFDRMLAGIRASLPTVEAHKAAILAGLAVTDELFQARRVDADLAGRLTGLAEEIGRLVPPGRRGGSGASAES